MPSIFKALASITVWILFVNGCAALIFVYSGTAHLVGGTLLIVGVWGTGIVSLILTVVAMKLRQMLE